MPTPPVIEPMLASTGQLRRADDGWSFEPKFDGWRVSVSVGGGGVVVGTRRGNQISQAVPERASLAGAVDASQLVLDRELIAGQGRARDFSESLSACPPIGPDPSSGSVAAISARSVRSRTLRH